MSGAEDAKSLSKKSAPPSEISAAKAPSYSIALGLISEIPKPRDWPVFQRLCVVLYQCELSDPHAMEYGRLGQNQQGIDIIGKRDGDPFRYVGVQCRLITKPLTYEEILSDCRKALDIKAELKEIIFATTAPDDKKATDAAIEVEKLLASEGHKLSVAVYGWDALQNKIALHPRAHQVFYQAAFPARETTLTDSAAGATQAAASGASTKPDTSGAVAYVSDSPTPDLAAEDPVLHARIDALAEFIREGQPKLAEQGLLKLLTGDALTQKPAARYRVIANLGSVALSLGREDEAAQRFESAHGLRPTDARAISFLALARTLQRRYSEAMDLARAALGTTPRADQAIGYLLQAAARSDWQGDPETLVPEDLKSSSHAALGLAEFWRRREVEGWEDRVIALGKAHPDVDEIRNVADMAVLTLALGGSDIMGMGGSVQNKDLNEAADHALRRAERLIEIGFTDQNDLAAHLNNAALLLRLGDRNKDAAALLQRGMAHVNGHPALARLHALTLLALGRQKDALSALSDQGPDFQNTLLSIEIRASDGDQGAAVAEALALKAADDPLIERIRWRIVSELAEKAKDAEAAKMAVEALRKLDAADPIADVAEARRRRIAGESEDQVHESLRAAASKLTAACDGADRFAVAEAMGDCGLDSEAADLLQGHVNLDRIGAATMLYLESLASARRDVAFSQAILQASEDVQNHLGVLRLRGAHAWNSGDLKTCKACVEAMLAKTPDAPWPRLMRMELMVREDRASELLTELQKPVEQLAWTRIEDRARIAALLAHMGFSERAAALAYRLFLENRDVSRAWMALSSVVLQEGLGGASDPIWVVETAGENAAVDIKWEDGGKEFFIVEPDAALRKLDPESWEPEHPLAQAALGMKVGDAITDAKGRVGKIAKLRHKYVARLHLVVEEHEKRFPTINGFQVVRGSPDDPAGTEDIKERLREIREYNDQQIEFWQGNMLPLSWLARRLGTDEIDLSVGLQGDKLKLKVAVGLPGERQAAAAAIAANGAKGCVLDLLSFWHAWRLKSLDAITATCGPIAIAQSTLDALRRRAEKLEFHAANGVVHTAGYEDGKIAITETSPDLMVGLAGEVKAAIAWIEEHDAAKPLIIGDDLDADIRKLVLSGHVQAFDGAMLAQRLGVLLVSDDLPTRVMAGHKMGVASTWSDQVVRAAANARVIDASTSVRWSAQLVGAGHDYIGTTGAALAQALRIDVEANAKIGYNFTTLAGTLGGPNAEPESHVRAAVEAIAHIWSDADLFAVREAATGQLLECLIRARKDLADILNDLYQPLKGDKAIRAYILGWVKGHFLFSSFRQNPPANSFRNGRAIRARRP